MYPGQYFNSVKYRINPKPDVVKGLDQSQFNMRERMNYGKLPDKAKYHRSQPGLIAPIFTTEYKREGTPSAKDKARRQGIAPGYACSMGRYNAFTHKGLSDDDMMPYHTVSFVTLIDDKKYEVYGMWFAIVQSLSPDDEPLDASTVESMPAPSLLIPRR